MEHTTSPSLGEVPVHPRRLTVWLAPCIHFCPTPASCLPRLFTLLFGWCCHGTVQPERGFTCSILCSLHRGPLTSDWGPVTQNTHYTKAAVWTDAQDSAALTVVGLPSPVNIQQRDCCRLEHIGWPFGSPKSFLVVFFPLRVLVLNATIFSGTKLGFSLILCTSMDTGGSVVSTRAEEQSFHVRYR